MRPWKIGSGALGMIQSVTYERSRSSPWFESAVTCVQYAALDPFTGRRVSAPKTRPGFTTTTSVCSMFGDPWVGPGPMRRPSGSTSCCGGQEDRARAALGAVENIQSLPLCGRKWVNKTMDSPSDWLKFVKKNTGPELGFQNPHCFPVYLRTPVSLAFSMRTSQSDTPHDASPPTVLQYSTIQYSTALPNRRHLSPLTGLAPFLVFLGERPHVFSIAIQNNRRDRRLVSFRDRFLPSRRAAPRRHFRSSRRCVHASICLGVSSSTRRCLSRLSNVHILVVNGVRSQKGPGQPASHARPLGGLQ